MKMDQQPRNMCHCFAKRYRFVKVQNIEFFTKFMEIFIKVPWKLDESRISIIFYI